MFKKSVFLCILVLICTLFASCVTQRACLLKFPPDTITKVTTIYRDTIINVPVLGTDTVYFFGKVTDTVYASSGTAHATTYVVHDTLKLNVWQSDTTLKVRLDSALQVIQQKDTQIITIQNKCEKGKGAIFVDKLIILFAVILGGILIIQLIKLFK